MGTMKERIMMAEAGLPWEKGTEDKFKQMVAKIPVFLRGTAEKKVLEEAEKILKSESLDQLTEKELIDAFFAATPFGFHGPMKTDMEAIGLDYQKYGHPR